MVHWGREVGIVSCIGKADAQRKAFGQSKAMWEQGSLTRLSPIDHPQNDNNIIIANIQTYGNEYFDIKHYLIDLQSNCAAHKEILLSVHRPVPPAACIDCFFAAQRLSSWSPHNIKTLALVINLRP